jgi:hypothetical protein
VNIIPFIYIYLDAMICLRGPDRLRRRKTRGVPFRSGLEKEKVPSEGTVVETQNPGIMGTN